MAELTQAHHAAIRFLFAERVRQRVSMPKLAKRAGVSMTTVKRWRHFGVSPTLPTIDSCLQALGYKLAVVPISHPDFISKDGSDGHK